MFLLKENCLLLVYQISQLFNGQFVFFFSFPQLNNLSELIASLVACELAIASSSNWRLHVELLEKFACFPKCLTSDQIYYKFVPLLFRLLSSNVSTANPNLLFFPLICNKMIMHNDIFFLISYLILGFGKEGIKLQSNLGLSYVPFFLVCVLQKH